MPSRVASRSARPPVETLPEMNACMSGREMLQLLFSALGSTHCCFRAAMCQVEVTDLTGICAHWVANGEGRGRGKRSTRAQGRPSVVCWVAACWPSRGLQCPQTSLQTASLAGHFAMALVPVCMAGPFFAPSTLCFLVGWSVASSFLWVFALWLDVQSEELPIKFRA